MVSIVSMVSMVSMASMASAQSVIHYVSNGGKVVAPPSGAFLDAENKELTISSNTYENGMGTITLSGDVAKFADGALYNMDLLYVTVPSTVTAIGKEAFNSCTHLQAILFESTSVPDGGTDGYAFSSSNMTIYAPLASYNKYDTAFESKTGVTYVCSWQDITLNSSGIGTFGDTSHNWLYYSNYNKNTGLQAYHCSGFTESSITFTQMYSSCKGKGVVLKGDANATYRLLETKEELSEVTNYMIASDGKNIEVATGKYILTSGTYGIGFYPLKSGTAVPVGKAYLDLGTSAGAKFLDCSFEDIPDGIENVEDVEDVEDVEYVENVGNCCDLTGRKIQLDQLDQLATLAPSGLYILNGKKYFRR